MKPVLQAAGAACARNVVHKKQVRWISFDLEIMRQMKAADSEYRAWLIREVKSSAEIVKAIAQAKAANLDGIDLNFNSSLVTSEMVAKAHAAGLEVGVWVSGSLPERDTPQSWEKAVLAGVDV